MHTDKHEEGRSPTHQKTACDASPPSIFCRYEAREYIVTVVESEDGFAVWCDELPGCCSERATRQEVMENIRIAVREYLDVAPEAEAKFGAKIRRGEVTV